MKGLLLQVGVLVGRWGVGRWLKVGASFYPAPKRKGEPGFMAACFEKVLDLLSEIIGITSVY